MSQSFGRCPSCRRLPNFQMPDELVAHFKAFHCERRGQLFICRCDGCKLKAELSEIEFQEHVRKCHTFNDASSAEEEPSKFWQMCKSSQNLSAVLNDPRRSRLNVPNFLVRYWGEGFVENAELPPLYHVRTVSWSAFKDYLAQIPYRIQRHEKDRNQALRSTLLSADQSNATGRLETSSLVASVPKIFFSESFSLANVETFNALTRLAIGGTTLSTGKTIANDGQCGSTFSRLQRTNRALQEQLGVYLDNVEIEIAKHLSSKSQAFFQLMSFHDELQKGISNASSVVQMLIQQMADVKQALSVYWLRLIALKVRRSRVREVLKKLDLIGTVVQTQVTLQSLLNSSDCMAALEVTSTTRAVLSEELGGVLCFGHLQMELCETEATIGQLLMDEFVRFLHSEFEPQPSAEQFISDFDEFQLKSLITGLLRQRQMTFCQLIKNEAFALLKVVIRQTARDQFENADELKSIAQTMRQCDFDTWLSAFNAICQVVLCFCKKINVMLECVLQLVRVASSESECDKEFECSMPSSTLQMLKDVKLNCCDRDTLIDSVRDLPSQIYAFATDRLCRVISARGKGDLCKSIGVESFASFVHLVESADVEFEKLTGGPVNSALKIQLRSLVDDFISRFYEDRKTKLTNIIDSESWQRAQVPQVFQDIVNEYETTGKLKDLPLDANVRESHGYRFYLSVKGEKFVVIGTALMLLQIIAQYCLLVESLPAYCCTIYPSLIELLKMYNSRSCQLVLGAGALQMVGLKKISSVHLALSCRSLQLICHFIPMLRDLFASKIASGSCNVGRRFGQLLKDYQDHASEVLGTIFGVLESCLEASMDQWSLSATLPSPQFSRLAKQVKRLYDSNYDILTPKDLQGLMLRFYDALHKSITCTLQARDIDAQKNPSEYKFAVDDFSLIVRSIQRLPCCTDCANLLLPTLV